MLSAWMLFRMNIQILSVHVRCSPVPPKSLAMASPINTARHDLDALPRTIRNRHGLCGAEFPGVSLFSLATFG